MPTLLEIRNQLQSERYDDDEYLINLHHILMREYGWIPIEEFKEIPLTMFWGLVKCITKEKEEEKEAYKGK